LLKATPLYGAGLEDPSLFYFQEQLNVTTESEIVVKPTASDAKSMSAEYGTAVRDLVAFYHWHFTAMRGSTTIAIRSYSNRSWSKCLNKLSVLVCEQ
jgi:hypothetical protein